MATAHFLFSEVVFKGEHVDFSGFHCAGINGIDAVLTVWREISAKSDSVKLPCWIEMTAAAGDIIPTAAVVLYAVRFYAFIQVTFICKGEHTFRQDMQCIPK